MEVPRTNGITIVVSVKAATVIVIQVVVVQTAVSVNVPTVEVPISRRVIVEIT